jgi:hypothetical protein
MIKKHPEARRSLLSVIAIALLAFVGRVYAQSPTPTPSPVEAVIAVERAVVFPTPDRNAEPLTYLYERERVPLIGQSPDGVFLLVVVDHQQGWILRAQADVSGDIATVPVTGSLQPPTPTITSFPVASATPVIVPTRTLLPSPTPALDATLPPDVISPITPEAQAPVMLPGVSPPLEITLPDGWQTVDLVVPLRTFDNEMHDVPLTIYFGTLDGDVNAFIYLYWGFPNAVDWVTGEYNLWADGVQILRGSLVGDTCNLGVYDQQTFMVGGLEGVGAYYQAAECQGEDDTAGWFTTVRVYNGSFAFYVAVEPWDARSTQRDNLQAILDSVKFLPPDKTGN